MAGDGDLGAALDLIEEGGEAVLGFVEGDEHGVVPIWLARLPSCSGGGLCSTAFQEGLGAFSWA